MRLNFARVNLEATLHLVEVDGEARASPAQPVDLVIRQGIEILIKDGTDEPRAVVFIELRDGQVRALVWDQDRSVARDEPVVHVLKEATPAPVRR